MVDAGARDANGDDDDDDDAVRVDDARALFERCRVAARALERAAMSAVSNREKCSTLQGQADATSWRFERRRTCTRCTMIRDECR